MYRIQNREFTLKKFVTAKERKDSYVFLMEAFKAISKVKDESMFAVELLYPDRTVKDEQGNDKIETVPNFEYWFKNLLTGDFEGIDFNDESQFDEYEQAGIQVITDFFTLRANSMKPKTN